MLKWQSVKTNARIDIVCRFYFVNFFILCLCGNLLQDFFSLLKAGLVELVFANYSNFKMTSVLEIFLISHAGQDLQVILPCYGLLCLEGQSLWLLVAQSLKLCLINLFLPDHLQVTVISLLLLTRNTFSDSCYKYVHSIYVYLQHKYINSVLAFLQTTNINFYNFYFSRNRPMHLLMQCLWIAKLTI